MVSRSGHSDLLKKENSGSALVCGWCFDETLLVGETVGSDRFSRSSSSSAEEAVSRKISREAATLRPMPCCEDWGSEPDEEDELLDERERDLGRGMGGVEW